MLVCKLIVTHALQDLPFTFLGAFALPLLMSPFWVPTMKWAFQSWHCQTWVYAWNAYPMHLFVMNVCQSLCVPIFLCLCQF